VIVPAPRARRRARIEIIPLIDVIFFLLATFMMVSLSMIQNRGIPVQLPAAETGAPLDRSDSATITVAADGALFFDEERVDVEALGRRLDALKAGHPDPRVYLGGDARAELGAAITVLDLVRARGIGKVAIETRPAPRDESR
jgi:biopolymer transport protein ExbD